MSKGDWSPQQEGAIKAVDKWLRSREQVFRLFGYAGTGKTTLATSLAANVKGRVLFGAFTGKAALVLRRKGCHDASTIHSMIYKVEEDEETKKPKFSINRDSSVASSKLVVIDECSMVDETLGGDLLSFGTKVLVLGDPAQLPPVKGGGFFTSQSPDVMLTEVHRQARDNPIIAMSMIVREGGTLKIGTYGSSRVIARDSLGRKTVLGADQMLVGLNRTRQEVNSKIRTLRQQPGDKLLGDYPIVGEKLVCLKNDKELSLLNGGLWIVAKVVGEGDNGVYLNLTPEDEPDRETQTPVFVRKEFFLGTEADIDYYERKQTQEFTFGYALTVHKSQGSQWDKVVVIDESRAFREDRAKHLYTAITRAASEVVVAQ